jgi:hypothetical protein
VLIQSIVARIAYLSSDVIISVQPAQAVESEFSTHLHRYSGRKDSGLVATSEGGVPEVRFFGNSVNIHMLSTNRYQDIKY